MMVCDAVMYVDDRVGHVVVYGIPCESITLEGSVLSPGIRIEDEWYPLSYLDGFREQESYREWMDFAYTEASQ